MTSIGPTIGNLGVSAESLHNRVREQAESRLGKGLETPGFTDRLSGALNEVAAAQANTAALTRAYEMGMENDISKVMVSQQVSSLGFQMTLNVRNKMLSAYKDIMNMPV